MSLGLGVPHFYRHPSGVQERLHELIHSASGTQGLHFVQELGMPDSVEGPFYAKNLLLALVSSCMTFSFRR